MVPVLHPRVQLRTSTDMAETPKAGGADASMKSASQVNTPMGLVAPQFAPSLTMGESREGGTWPGFSGRPFQDPTHAFALGPSSWEGGLALPRPVVPQATPVAPRGGGVGHATTGGDSVAIAPGDPGSPGSVLGDGGVGEAPAPDSPMRAQHHVQEGGGQHCPGPRRLRRHPREGGAGPCPWRLRPRERRRPWPRMTKEGGGAGIAPTPGPGCPTPHGPAQHGRSSGPSGPARPSGPAPCGHGFGGPRPKGLVYPGLCPPNRRPLRQVVGGVQCPSVMAATCGRNWESELEPVEGGCVPYSSTRGWEYSTTVRSWECRGSGREADPKYLG
jgi:hypothetical protein